MASDPEFALKSEWYKALTREDCCGLKKHLPKLLRDDEGLLHEGWTEDKQTQMWVQQNLERSWKGRTPLHVAARRGDVQLTNQILELISCSGTPEATGGGDDACSDSALCQILTVADGDYDLDALAMAVVNGNRAVVNSLKNASLQCKSNPYNIRADFRKKGKDQSEAARPMSHSREGGKSTDQNDAPGLVLDENGAIMDEAHPDWEDMRTLSEITKTVLNKLEESDRQKIETLYGEDCDFNFLERSVYLFNFTFSTWKAVEALKTLAALGALATLGAVGTVEAQDAVRALRAQNAVEAQKTVETVEAMDAVIGTIRKDILSAVKAGPLKYLLFNLKDGQGRTALHVAVDSGSDMVDKFLNLIPSVSGGRDENQICCSFLKRKKFSSVQGKKNVQHEHQRDGLDGEDTDQSICFDCQYLNATDSAGRTPLYRASAKNIYRAVKRLLQDKRTDVTVNVTYPVDKWGADLDLDKLSTRSGFKSDSVYIRKTKLWNKGFNNKTNALGGPGPYLEPLLEASSTALHVAIIHKYDLVVKAILEHDDNHSKTEEVDLSCIRRYTWPVTPDPGSYEVQRSVSPMQLCVLVGNIPVLQLLLEYQLTHKKKAVLTPALRQQNRIPSFHLAAAMGKPDSIKAFIDTGGYNSLIKDKFGNTALHHALNGKNVQFYPHLIDFVGCHHVFSWRWENDEWVSAWLADSKDEETANTNKTEDDQSQVAENYGQREGAISLLLQVGVDIWERNEDGRTARPRPGSSEDFVTWWYDQVAAETQQEQATLGAAANAISVTAALVATASYTGPFAPPLGYGDSGVQAGILALRIFVVCNNISFYFALSAIMFSLLPSVPMPEESTFKELRKTRIQVAIALLFLLPSICCIIMAFASCYIAALPEHGLAHHSLVLTSTVVGAAFCLIVIIRFLLRLGNVLLTLPRGPTNEINLVEEFFSGGEALAMRGNVKSRFKAARKART